MFNKSFYNFLFLLLFTHKSKHISIFIISTILVFILASVNFISNSISKDVLNSIDSQPDFIVQKMKAGQVIDINTNLVDKIESILGVNKVTTRVYGKYYFKALKQSFTIVGVDFFEEQNNKNLSVLIKNLDMKKFLQKEYMIIGNGVKKLFDKYKYDNSYFFTTALGESVEVEIYDSLDAKTSLLSNDMIIMPKELAKIILGIGEFKATDIALNVPNELEKENIKVQLILLDDNLRVLSKKDVKSHFLNLFNYKGGLFLILYIVVILTFLLILYQRYSMINSSDKKEIAILKAVGWSIKDILKLKVLENFLVAFFSFSFGIIFAFIYVFLVKAPFLINIFLGYSNLDISYEFTPYVSLGSIITIFIFFVIPFLCVILVPVWKIATVDVIKSIK
ncbi:ABC transporter permease [Malaciobacter molluscorum LMG 25693]|uniref:ABC transporter permease n=1 Tax=Malaciobacter molluscorum LMG 25693 TaxID=870501 RepID=A0A2G1DGI0_9BACT|nr:FtsX-like permease family protein [Malaciobacter molluscorum]AXX92522.1 ABC transporter, permease protein, FtsX/LolE family [Malaciobacter molluscorum LMG 25693]PHO17609.1 ABC transporter permease [Malaciobacter molluscorum LMG 25693]RXJ93493.1 ABC transporter permease [Malaciobacter molluscorum]